MVTIQTILEKVSGIDFIGNKNMSIDRILPISESADVQSALSWVNEKNTLLLKRIEFRTIICSVNTDRNLFNQTCNYILVNNPRNEFRKVLELFAPKDEIRICSTAQISEMAIVGYNVSIGHNVVVEDSVVIGDNTIVGHNTVIKKDCQIGKNVKIGSGCVVGGLGFGYEKDESGEYVFIPHIGNVEIEDFVEIGNCTAIDRAVIGSTRIGQNCKIDNLVHIAHGVVIGKNSLIIANAMIAGSVNIGENTWVAPSSSILNGKKVGNNALIGMGAVVLKDVEEGDVWTGNPAKFLRKIKLD